MDIKQLINDPNVNFFLAPTTELKQLVIANAHPSIQKWCDSAKAAILEDMVIPLDKQDVCDFVHGQLSEDGAFVFSKGEIRVVGEPSLQVPKTK